MSRVGRLPIAIPAGVTVTVTPDNVVTVKGPKGELTKAMVNNINIAIEDNQVVVTRPSDIKEHRALHGLTRA
ncbi:50S ribosomal protein L6, partial [Clostridium sp.]